MTKMVKSRAISVSGLILGMNRSDGGCHGQKNLQGQIAVKKRQFQGKISPVRQASRIWQSILSAGLPAFADLI